MLMIGNSSYKQGAYLKNAQIYVTILDVRFEKDNTFESSKY